MAYQQSDMMARMSLPGDNVGTLLHNYTVHEETSKKTLC